MIIVISYMTIYHSELIVRKSTSNNQLHHFGMVNLKVLWFGNWKSYIKILFKKKKIKIVILKIKINMKVE